MPYVHLLADHTEKLVKVNAWVAETIAGVVEALNEFDGVVTLYNKAGPGAHVYFRIRSGMAADYQRMADALFSATGGRSIPGPDYTLTLEWHQGECEPLGKLSFSENEAETLASRIQVAASYYNAWDGNLNRKVDEAITSWRRGEITETTAAERLGVTVQGFRDMAKHEALNE